MMWKMNGKPPKMLYLLDDFLPTKKKQKHGNEICTYAARFDRSLPEKKSKQLSDGIILKKISIFL